VRPSKLKPGMELRVIDSFGEARTAFFVRREPRRYGHPAVNYVRFPDYAGLDGPEDDGTCQMSDYDLSRRGQCL